MDLIFSSTTQLFHFCETGNEENLGEIARLTMSINCEGPIYLTDKIIDFAKEGGHVIFVSSRYGLVKFKNSERREQFMEYEKITKEKFNELKEQFLISSDQKSWENDGWINDYPLDNAYSISKMFLNLYVRMLNDSLKRKNKNIKVNAVHPGRASTEMGGPNAPYDYYYAAQFPVLLAEFSSSKDESLSGNFYFEDKLHYFYV